MAKLSYKVSYYVLYALFAIIGIVLVLFYGVGYSTPWEGNPSLSAPQYTDALLYLKYILTVITIALAVLAGVAQFFSSMKDNPKGAVKSLIALALLVGVLVVTYAMGSDEAILVNGLPYTDSFWLKSTDMFLYSMYILCAGATVATIVNMSGIFKK